MEEVKLNPNQSLSVVAFFLDSIWDKCPNKFSEFGRSEFGVFLSSLFGDPSSDTDWLEVYKLTFGKSLCRKDLLTLEEVFTSMIELCAMYAFQGAYQIFEVINLLHSIRYKPQEHTQELEFWKQAIQRVLNGEIPKKVIFD